MSGAITRCAAAALGLWALAGPALGAADRAAERVVRVAAPGASDGANLRDALGRAAMRARSPGGPVVVLLAPGTYRLVEPIQIGPELGGTLGAPLVIRGAPGGATRILGSVPVSTVPLPADLAARLPQAARGRVRAYRLPEASRGAARIRGPRLLQEPSAPLTLEVHDAHGALSPARWPNAGFARVAPGPDGDAFGVVGAKAARWRGEDDLWAEGYWHWDWLFETIPIVGLDPRPGASAPLRLDSVPYAGVSAGARVRIVHALGELDEPGEWWRDRGRNLLLVWPREGAGEIEVTVSETLLAVAGARHVRIEGLRLERSRGDLLTVRGGADVVVRDSALAWAGLRAAVFEDVIGGGIEACSIHDAGFGAVRLASGDRPSLAPGGLFLRDSRLTGYARLSRTQSPAVQVDGVGALVEGNYVHDAVDFAVHLRGNDHRFTGNEITRVLMGATDSGAIYAGRDWTARGSIIRGNFLHDIRTEPGFEVKGVYLDDMASGFTVADNLFLRVDQPAFIGGGRDNTVIGNVFADSSPAVHLDARGLEWAAGSVADPESEIRAALAAMPVASPLWRRRYPTLAGILAEEPGVPRGNRILANVFWASVPFRYEAPARVQDQTVRGNVETKGPPPGPGDDPADFAAPPVGGPAIPLPDAGRMRRSTLPEAPVRAR